MDTPKPAKGRGAVSNPQSRFERLARDAFDDGWGADPDALPSEPQTTVSVRPARSIIARNDSPDVPFTQSINPYQGCEHGCIYCYARPTHAYLGLSPGLDFETRLFAKSNAAELLRKELSAPGYRCESIALGANTDPYQPIERQLGITRSLLEVMRDFNQPLSITTKSSLVERDLDLLAPMADARLARVFVSVTTLDPAVARTLEPRATAPRRRLETIRRLNAAGVRCGVLVAPVVPFLNDGDLEAILEAASASGARSAAYIVLRLPLEVRDLFKAWLEIHFPMRAAHVMARVRDIRGGRENDPRFGSRMTGEGLFADLIERRFVRACWKLALNAREDETLDTTRFRVPGRGDQLELL